MIGTPCVLWQHALTPDGYGHLGRARDRQAHRAAWAAINGPIPEGMEIDHLCHTEDLSCPGGKACLHRRCVNPEHLEPVSHRENALRGRSFAAVNAAKTHCPQDHPYDETNTYIDGRGRRRCKKCLSVAKRRRTLRAKARRDAADTNLKRVA